MTKNLKYLRKAIPFDVMTMKIIFAVTTVTASVFDDELVEVRQNPPRSFNHRYLINSVHHLLPGESESTNETVAEDELVILAIPKTVDLDRTVTLVVNANTLLQDCRDTTRKRTRTGNSSNQCLTAILLHF